MQCNVSCLQQWIVLNRCPRKAGEGSQPPLESERASPALDVSILEHPSARLQIEIRHRKLEDVLEQYNQTIAQGAEDPSVMQFVTDHWPALQAKVESIHTHLASGHHTAQRNSGAERESAFSLTPRSHNSLFSSSANPAVLATLNRKLECMLVSDAPLMGDSFLQHDSSHGPPTAAAAPFVSSMSIRV
jgi:hypothetical protein